MSYDERLLFAEICKRLDQAPTRSLLDLSREFQVGTRTIQKAVATVTGTKFSDLKDDVLIARLTRLFMARPHSSIKQLSFELGYESTRTFTHAVRRACGHSPTGLRKRVLSDAGAQTRIKLKAATTIH